MGLERFHGRHFEAKLIVVADARWTLYLRKVCIWGGVATGGVVVRWRW